MKIKPSECTFNGYPFRYCPKCGSELVYKFKFHHYDVGDATKMFTGRATCPNHKYFWDGHISQPMYGYGTEIMFEEYEIPEEFLPNE